MDTNGPTTIKRYYSYYFALNSSVVRFQSAYGPHQNHRRFYSIAVFKLNHAMVSGVTSYLNKCLLGNKWLRL